MSRSQSAELEIKVGFFPLAFMFLLCKPVIVIDGERHRRAWGTHYFDVEPGRHKITIYFPYLFLSECGKNSIVVDVRHDETCGIKFFMPPWAFSKGAISEF